MRTVLIVAASAVGLLPVSGLHPAPVPQARVAHPATCQSVSVRRAYAHRYDEVRRTFGPRSTGPNLRRTASCAKLSRSNRTFDRWLGKWPVAKPGDRVPTSTLSRPEQTGAHYAIPTYIVACESHGSYFAYNPSGASGAYQIMRSTAQAYGCDVSTPGGQDRCAAKIWADDGPRQWECG